MGNTLTNLIPDFYRALDVVSRELSGFIPASTFDFGVARAAIGENVRVPITPAAAAENVTAAQLPPDTGDQTIDNVVLQITKSRGVPFRWTGEEQKGINMGPGYLTIRQDQIAQALRTLVNEVETDLAVAALAGCSRAYGTAGTLPFGNTTPAVNDLTQVLKMLKDNGCPETDLQLVVNTTVGAQIRVIPNLYKVSEAGDSGLLRQSILGQLFNFNIRESAASQAHTKGTGSGYLVNTGGPALAAGTTTIPCDTGTGTIVAGDVVTFAADSANKYMVVSDLSGGSFKIGSPGLLVSVAENNAITVGNNFTASCAFHRSSLILATRAPALPDEGDSAVDRTTITDPRTGLTFELAMYAEFRRIRYLVALAWGCKGIKPNHSVALLG